MLASLRPFMQFIDLDSTFCAHGFTKKVGDRYKVIFGCHILNVYTGRCGVQDESEEAGGV